MNNIERTISYIYASETEDNDDILRLICEVIYNILNPAEDESIEEIA